MGTNLQNNLIVQFQGDIMSASTSVPISTDLERSAVVTASGCYAVIRNKNGSKIERVKGDAAAGTFTFTKRGLDQSDSDVEVAGLKKAWKTGQTMYITLLSSQIVDKQNSNTYGTGSTQTFYNLEFTGTSKGRVFADLAALNTAYPTPTNGLVDMYCTAEGQFYDAAGGSWVARASGTNPNASTTVAGKVETSIQAETDALTPVGATGAQLFTPQDYIPATQKTTLVADDFVVVHNSADSNHKAYSKMSDIFNYISNKQGVSSYVLGETIASNKNVVVMPDGKLYQLKNNMRDTGLLPGTYTGARSCTLPNDKVAMLAINGTAMTLYIGTLDLATNVVTYGTGVVLSEATAGDYNVCKVDTDKVYCQRNNGNNVRGVVFSISGAVPTEGVKATVNDTATSGARSAGLQSCTYIANGVIGSAFKDGDGGSTAKVKVATISGTTLNFGTSGTMFAGSNTNNTSIQRISATLIAAADSDGINTRLYVATVSGNAVTMGANTNILAGVVTSYMASDGTYLRCTATNIFKKYSISGTTPTALYTSPTVTSINGVCVQPGGLIGASTGNTIVFFSDDGAAGTTITQRNTVDYGVVTTGLPKDSYSATGYFFMPLSSSTARIYKMGNEVRAYKGFMPVGGAVGDTVNVYGDGAIAPITSGIDGMTYYAVTADGSNGFQGTMKMGQGEGSTKIRMNIVTVP